MTVRATLAKHKKDIHGRSPIKICVTVQGKRTYYSTGKRVKESDWNGQWVKKNVVGAGILNEYLRKQIHEVERKLTQIQNSGEKVTVEKASRKIRSKSTDDLFFPYCEQLLKELKKKKSAGTITNYRKCLNKLKDYKSSFHFSDVDSKFLRGFEGQLNDEGYSPNYIFSMWKKFKSFFNHARKDGVTDHYPFTSYDNPRSQQTMRVFLTMEEIEKIEALLIKPLPQYFIVTINYFLLSCYSGLRYSDYSRFNYEGFVQGDRLMLRAKKNGEIISMKMHDKLKLVVERLRELPKVYTEQKVNEYLKGIATMAEVNKNITTHCGRHSYSAHCIRLGMSDHVIAQSMGITTRTLQVYKHLLNTTLDKELEKWNLIQTPNSESSPLAQQ